MREVSSSVVASFGYLMSSDMVLPHFRSEIARLGGIERPRSYFHTKSTGLLH